MEEAGYRGAPHPTGHHTGRAQRKPASAHLFWWVKWTFATAAGIHGLADENEDIRPRGKPGKCATSG